MLPGKAALSDPQIADGGWRARNEKVEVGWGGGCGCGWDGVEGGGVGVG